MTQLQIAEARAPYVMFEKRAVEDRAASIASGQYTTRDEDYALITPQGSKDQVERIASEWFVHLAQEAQNGRFPSEWLRAFKHAYAEWQAGNEAPVNGTPIKSWPIVSPSQRANLIQWKIFTVEALAEANEEVLTRLGMGGRQLKRQAIDYLTASKDTGKIAQELNALRIRVEQAETDNKALRETNQMLIASLPTRIPEGAVANDEPGTAGGLLDEPAAVSRNRKL